MGCLGLFHRLSDLEFPLRYDLQKLAIDLQLLRVDNFTVFFLLLKLTFNKFYINIVFASLIPHDV